MKKKKIPITIMTLNRKIADKIVSLETSVARIQKLHTEECREAAERYKKNRKAPYKYIHRDMAAHGEENINRNKLNLRG